MNFINKAVCEKCGGACCKHAAGACLPSDFGSTAGEIEQNVRAAVATGKYAIDWWEGDPRDDKDWTDPDALSRAYFVRPAHVGASHPRDPSWGGTCVFHGPKGCALEHDKRPSVCRALEPITGPNDCKMHLKGGAKRGPAIAWIPFTDVLESIE